MQTSQIGMSKEIKYANKIKIRNIDMISYLRYSTLKVHMKQDFVFYSLFNYATRKTYATTETESKTRSAPEDHILLIQRAHLGDLSSRMLQRSLVYHRYLS
jgi:hypothetical protein